jgi:carbon storage regulator
MLVLSRKVGESIIIGDRIQITVVEVSHGRVKIGVKAPSDVKIDREEIHTKKLLELDPEAAIPVLHNRIVDALTDPAAITPSPSSDVKGIDFLKKPR